MKREFWYFLFFFLLLNLCQAAFTSLTGDEALYWMYWNHIDWGFKDHPPTIGVLIGLGYSVFENELGARLMIVLANALTVVLIARLVNPQKIWHFVLLLLSLPALNLYGFIATPDVPLLLATALYLTIWKKFIEEQSLKNMWLLGLCMAALVWSKYHGILIIVFTLLPQKSIWFNKRFWLAALLGIVLYTPHIYWQIVHDLPTVKFHLNDRNSDAWELKHILGYVGGQFILFNPVILIWALVLMIRMKSSNAFERSLRWLIVGLFLLFFFNSFRGRVEPHWTAPLSIPILYILFLQINKNGLGRGVQFGLGFFALAILFVRIALVFDIVPQLHRDFHRDKSKMKAIHNFAGDMPVCFMNSYQNPSMYMFYTNGKAHSINNTEGGKNQFDYWNYNEYINEKPFLFVASYDAPGFGKVTSDELTFDVKVFDDLPVLHALNIHTDEWLHYGSPGDTARIAATITNRNAYAIHLKNGVHRISWKAMFNHKKYNEANPELQILNLPDRIESGKSARIELRFRVPDLKGKNYLIFAAQVDDLPPTYQSNRIRMMIE